MLDKQRIPVSRCHHYGGRPGGWHRGACLRGAVGHARSGCGQTKRPHARHGSRHRGDQWW